MKCRAAVIQVTYVTVMNSILLFVWQEGKTLKWRVENSWGEDYGVKGESTVTKAIVFLFP